jgi:hypothetical protein
MRDELSRRGISAAERFSWAHVGGRFSDLLHRVAVSDGLVAPVGGAASWEDDGSARAVTSGNAGVSAGAEPAE